MKKGRGHYFSILQKIGQSLMIPVSVLPAAGLLVALGRMIQNISQVAAGTQSKLFFGFGQILYSGGMAIFEQLPVVFAVGVAIGFTSGAGVAALSSVVGYFTILNVISVLGEIRQLGFEMNTGVFGGIMIGLVTARIYNKYSETKFHPIFGFFSGKRLVPIITAVAAIGMGLCFGFIWPPIQERIREFGIYITSSSLGPAFYAAGKRLLIPVGLHHVYYPPFLFEFGEFITNTGQILHGESPRYFAGDPAAGKFMASEFPIMLFGLPAAALAMVLRADKNKRRVISGIMLSAALTSMITGITEPIEFTFIFVGPMLYVFHVGAAFLSGVLTNYFNVRLGYTFSASLIDYIVGFYNQENSIYLFLVIGPIIGILYFTVFYWLIGALNIKTLGREGEEQQEIFMTPASEKAVEVLKALGDVENIQHIDACITRLRLAVQDFDKVDQNRLRQLGAAGIFHAGSGNFQAIFGTEADMLRDQIKSIIGKHRYDQVEESSDMDVEVNRLKGEKREQQHVLIYAPISGEIMQLEEVPDDLFAEKIIGDGIAIYPSDHVVCSPVNGEVIQLFRTNHAIGILSEEGVEILIHIGIDTVKMNGEGFQVSVSQGDKVRIGDHLMTFDPTCIQKKAKSIITPIIIINNDDFNGIQVLKEGKIKTKDELLKIHL
ncbi:glucose-specific phosphotransferase system IIA component [Anaerosolibacter carboniphilus]|uniref:Glucose-specific phosphotransferase system IIA component n=1 Tax=Anaerosolibacter carboniphilus TaxID=1417629 RepID=A0A841KWY1_9FIRM|nr:PTS transporter subunit IIABC [Anaerosolibacter carboniphilus]MBB6217867.1 glucose-specific phosphotransferase system IIA component [Anaerosolibacter carboniphilus]